MFEQELEMERRESSVVPLLLIVALILAVVGVAGYYIIQNRKVLSDQEATSVAETILKNQGPATVRFHTGLVKGSVDDAATAPHYKLLEKVGLLTMGKGTGQWGTTIPVGLTANGEEMLKHIQDVQSAKEKDGSTLYQVPLAERKLVSVSNIKMINPVRANVDITWKWVTNPLGDLFDAGGPTVKAFSTWDRATLIQKHGAAFYHDAPTKVTLGLAKSDNGTWGVTTD